MEKESKGNIMKRMIILRGVSGCGKSTRARELCSKVSTAIICSADDYFMINGKYTFDPAKLEKAHEQCRSRAEKAAKDSVSLIVIDNTNTCHWEYKAYIDIGKEYGYDIEIIKVGSLDDDSLKSYAKRNKHGVSLQIIRKMAKRFEWSNKNE